MGKDAQDQLLNILNPDKLHGIWLNTSRVPAGDVPMLISKKWLCHHFDLVYPNGRCNIRGLYTHVLTPRVIREMGMTELEMRSQGLKTFDRQQTVMLIRLLQL